MLHDLPAAIGPYPVLRRLGSGGMAEVLLARSLGASGFERLVALSRLPLIAQVFGAAYAGFAKNRLRLTGRCDNDACELPRKRAASA